MLEEKQSSMPCYTNAEELKHQRELIKEGFALIENRFEQIDRRLFLLENVCPQKKQITTVNVLFFNAKGEFTEKNRFRKSLSSKRLGVDWNVWQCLGIVPGLA